LLKFLKKVAWGFRELQYLTWESLKVISAKFSTLSSMLQSKENLKKGAGNPHWKDKDQYV
jgi:hypothetical protein